MIGAVRTRAILCVTFSEKQRIRIPLARAEQKEVKMAAANWSCPSGRLRWLEKPDGTKTLQQFMERDGYVPHWMDVHTEKAPSTLCEMVKEPCRKCNGTGGHHCWDCIECGGHGYILRSPTAPYSEGAIPERW